MEVLEVVEEELGLSYFPFEQVQQAAKLDKVLLKDVASLVQEPLNNFHEVGKVVGRDGLLLKVSYHPVDLPAIGTDIISPEYFLQNRVP